MICHTELSSCTSVPFFPRVQIGNALVDACLFDDMTDAILHTAAFGDEPQYVVTPNVQHVALLAKDDYLRRIYSEAAFVLPDGISLLLAARCSGAENSRAHSRSGHVSGAMPTGGRRRLTRLLTGGRPGSAEKAAARLRSRYRGLIVCGTCCPPMGFENDPCQQHDIEARIRSARPHLLFVAFGAPKQEYWIYEHARQLGVPVTMGVGGSFEMVGGVIARAPIWLQKIGFEWLYRLVREPRRLWKRYLIGIIQFAQVVMHQRSGGESDVRMSDVLSK